MFVKTRYVRLRPYEPFCVFLPEFVVTSYNLILNREKRFTTKVQAELVVVALFFSFSFA